MKPIAASLALTLLAALPVRAAPVPEWLSDAVRASDPSATGRCVVLHDEQVVKVPDKGRIVVTTRWAVRVLTRDGADAAAAAVAYVRGSAEVRGLRAWTVAPGGGVLRQWERKDALDVSDVGQGELYSEFRHLELSDDAIQAGQIFGYEAVTEEDPLFAQWQWQFRSQVACALSRFSIELPPGLDVTVRSAHLDSAKTQHEGGRWSWEMHSLPALRREELAPWRPDLGPYLCVEVTPASGDHSSAGEAFRNWRAASEWLAALGAGSSAITPELAARTSEIARAVTDTLARIEALARFVQSLNYVARDEGIGRGWGYRPHDAATVLRAGFGDCKDKANLLCTMLRSSGVEAWLLPVYSGSRDRVDTAWASPNQFNHCITAIRSPRSYTGSLLEGDRQGRLIAFDPTDPLTAFGDLPRDEQGAWGLLVRPGQGDLVRLPVQRAEANHLERRLDAELDATGRLSVGLIERSTGQAARDERLQRRAGTDRDYARLLEAWLAAQGGNVELRSWASSDDSLSGRFVLTAAFTSPTFARLVAGRMLTFRGALIWPRHSWWPTDTTRTMPIALPGECVDETLTVRLPEGFAIDEQPTDVHVANDLGRLDATWVLAERALALIRRWQLQPRTVEAGRWADVRALYAALRATNEATVVLTRR